jgi:hypothetical protein
VKCFALILCVFFLFSCTKDPLPKCIKSSEKGVLCYSQIKLDEETILWTDYHHNGSQLIAKEVFNGNNIRTLKVEYSYDSLNRPIRVEKRNNAFQKVEYNYQYFQDSSVIQIDSFGTQYLNIRYRTPSYEVWLLKQDSEIINKDSTLFENDQIMKVFSFENGDLVSTSSYEWFVNEVVLIEFQNLTEGVQFTIQEAYDNGLIINRDIIQNEVVTIAEDWVYEEGRILERTKTDLEEGIAIKEVFVYTE